MLVGAYCLKNITQELCGNNRSNPPFAEDNKFTLLIWKRCSGCVSRMSDSAGIYINTHPICSLMKLVYDSNVMRIISNKISHWHMIYIRELLYLSIYWLKFRYNVWWYDVGRFYYGLELILELLKLYLRWCYFMLKLAKQVVQYSIIISEILYANLREVENGLKIP